MCAAQIIISPSSALGQIQLDKLASWNKNNYKLINNKGSKQIDWFVTFSLPDLLHFFAFFLAEKTIELELL